MKHILVTGGFGFIGSHLVEELLELGHYVTVVDNNSTCPIDYVPFVDDLIRNHGDRFTYKITHLHLFDISNRNTFDEIYHLASPVGPASVILQGGNMIRDVVRDVYKMIDYCTHTGAKLLDVSTSEVYGGGDGDGLCSEETPKIFPHVTNMRMEYAIAKLAAETAIINTCTVTKKLWSIIIRPFNVAGPRQSSLGGFVIPRFVQQAVNGMPYTVFNDGSDVRSFTHVKDIVDGLILAMEYGKRGEVYNLGNPHNKIAIRELPRYANNAMYIDNPTSFINPVELYGEHYRAAADKYPNADKAINELGWTPTRTIRDIVSDYYDDYMDQLMRGILKDDLTKHMKDDTK